MEDCKYCEGTMITIETTKGYTKNGCVDCLSVNVEEARKGFIMRRWTDVTTRQEADLIRSKV